MLFRSVLASAVTAVALLSTPAVAQDAAALKAQVGAYVQPSNAERMNVLVGQLRAAGFTPTLEPFEGGYAAYILQRVERVGIVAVEFGAGFVIGKGNAHGAS